MSIGVPAVVVTALLVIVLLVAWMGIGYRNQRNRLVSSPDLLATEGLAVQTTDISPVEIALGPLDSPYVKFSRALVHSDYKTEQFPLNDSVQKELRSWLQHVPRLAMDGGNLLAANRYVVSFSPEVTRALSNGSMELMQSGQGGYYAIAVNANGKRIVQTGLIQKAGFPVTAIPGLLWQVAAIVTAQRFLSEINKELAKIGEAVEFITRYLEAERIGSVQASFDRLNEIITAMNSGKWELHEARRWTGMLDDLDIESSKIVKAQLAQKEDFLQKAANIDMGRLIGTFRVKKTLVKQAVQVANNFGSHFGLCAAALYVRAATAQVRAALPVGRAELPTRLVSCSQDSRALREVNEQQFAMWSKPGQDAKAEKKALFSRDATKRHARKTITNVANATHNRLNADLNQVDRVIANTQASLTTADKVSAEGLMLELTVGNDGSVLGATRITV